MLQYVYLPLYSLKHFLERDTKGITGNIANITSHLNKSMERITRQQKRKMCREFENNKWHIENWQRMRFIQIMDDVVNGGSMEAYANDMYQCFLRKLPEGVRYLSIKRTDRYPIRNWQHLQQIKNDICGAESEGVELYPAMSRIADAANQYHIWVLPEGEKFPFGFNDKFVNMNQLK